MLVYDRERLDRINLIVLADHGMASVPRANSVLIDQRIPLDEVQVVSLGVLAAFVAVVALAAA